MKRICGSAQCWGVGKAEVTTNMASRVAGRFCCLYSWLLSFPEIEPSKVLSVSKVGKLLRLWLGCSLEDRGIGVWFPVQVKCFHHLHLVSGVWGRASPTQSLPAALSAYIKGSDHDRSHHCSAEHKNGWSYTSSYPYSVIKFTLTRANLTLLT